MVFGLFNKGFDPDAFEKDLTGITDNISKTQGQVARLQSRAKQLRSHLLRILVVSYLLLNAYNYSQVPQGIIGQNRVQLYLKGLTGTQLIALGAFPLIGYALLWLLDLFFRVLTKNRTSKLNLLRKKHAAKIDELKKITNFNTTNRLLTKYGTKEESQVSKSIPASQKVTGPKTKLPATVNQSKLTEKQKKEIAKLNLSTSAPLASPDTPVAGQNFQSGAPVGSVPGVSCQPNSSRTIQDRLLDLLIGSDDRELTEKRFALICSNCYTHNGLAPPNSPDPAQVKYLCFKCGSLNGSNAWDLDLKKLKEGIPESERLEHELEKVKTAKKEDKMTDTYETQSAISAVSVPDIKEEAKPEIKNESKATEEEENRTVAKEE